MVSDWNILVWKRSKIAEQFFFFLTDFALQNKVETTLPDGLETYREVVQLKIRKYVHLHILRLTTSRSRKLILKAYLKSQPSATCILKLALPTRDGWINFRD